MRRQSGPTHKAFMAGGVRMGVGAKYFRMSDEILSLPCVRDLMECTKGDNGAGRRFLSFICILTESVSGGKEFRDAQSVSTITGVGAKDAQRVWDICVRHGVLRKATYGYTAWDWLIDGGFIDKEAMIYE